MENKSRARIPDTNYTLQLDEMDDGHRRYYEDHKLKCPDFKISEGQRAVIFALTQSSGGSLSVIHPLGSIAAIAYEGKLLPSKL